MFVQPPRTSRRDVTQYFSPDSNPILSPATIGARDEGLVKSPKTGREFSRTVSARLSRRREQFRGPAGDPVSQQADPLANRGIGAAQAVAERRKRRQRIDRPARAPIDRIGFDREAGGAEGGNGARHVIGRGHQNPALARLRIGEQAREYGVLDGVARLL